MSSHSWEDHEKVASVLRKTRHPWILTYDSDDRVRNLYGSPHLTGLVVWPGYPESLSVCDGV